MTEICVQSDFMLGLLTEIGSTRALSEQETDLIEDIVAMEQPPAFRWNPRLDQALIRSAHSKGGIRRFADRHRITHYAAYIRLSKIRKLDRVDKSRRMACEGRS